MRLRSNRYSAGVELDSSVNVPKDLPHWVDGTKMVKLAKFARDRVRPRRRLNSS